jgi:hypothetical protein
MLMYDDLGATGYLIHLLGGVEMYQDECWSDPTMSFRFEFNHNTPRFHIQDQTVIQRSHGVFLRRWNHVVVIQVLCIYTLKVEPKDI